MAEIVRTACGSWIWALLVVGRKEIGHQGVGDNGFPQVVVKMYALLLFQELASLRRSSVLADLDRAGGERTSALGWCPETRRRSGTGVSGSSSMSTAFVVALWSTVRAFLTVFAVVGCPFLLPLVSRSR